jgi:very-short-patch-repair endonuclease
MRLEDSGSGWRNAQRLRKAMTSPEIGLWLALRRNSMGLRFRR